MRTNLLLGAAAVGVLITGAIAQTTSNIERIKDPAGQQNSAREAEPKRNVRTVYPNTQNAEQAAQQSKSAQGESDASKRKAGDVTPMPSTQQPAGQASTPAAQPAQAPQQSAQKPNTPQQTPPAPNAQQSAPAPATTGQGTPSAQPASPPPATSQQPAASATAQQSPASSQTPASQPGRASSSSSVIALDTQQQTSIGQAMAQRGIKPLTNVTFSIGVGTKVPAAVQLRALPSDLATFIPQYRGYSYVVVEEQIVIVDPGTHEIVAIVPYTAAAPATRTVETPKPRTPVAEKPMVNRPVNLNTEEKSVSQRPAAEHRKKTTRSVVKREYREERAPRSVTIEEEPIRGPAIRSHRFIDDDDEAVIVAPRQNGFFGLFR